MSASEETPGPPAGPGVDARGVPVVDPSKNVDALVELAVKRLDDLRVAENKRLDDLRELGEKHLEKTQALIAKYEDKLRLGETARIDAIRAVDVAAVQRATEVAADTAAALAAQVNVSAETLRNQVTAAAEAQARNLQTALAPIALAVEELRRAQYEAQGQKTQVIEARAGISSTTTILSSAIALLFVVLALYAATRSRTPTSPIIVQTPTVTTPSP